MADTQTRRRGPFPGAPRRPSSHRARQACLAGSAESSHAITDLTSSRRLEEKSAPAEELGRENRDWGARAAVAVAQSIKVGPRAGCSPTVG